MMNVDKVRDIALQIVEYADEWATLDFFILVGVSKWRGQEEEHKKKKIEIEVEINRLLKQIGNIH